MSEPAQAGATRAETSPPGPSVGAGLFGGAGLVGLLGLNALKQGMSR
jgi:hypothetical protein